jgi:hypothetical protein
MGAINKILQKIIYMTLFQFQIVKVRLKIIWNF